jgi:tRNA-splicing ligase RtcB (3'-phosphate/5'-hydroxy nucleic acid ligase)
MKIKLNKVYSNFIKNGFELERISPNVIHIKGQSDDLPMDILLPEDFELEKDAVSQFLDFANFVSPSGKKMKCACATPDFHPGSTIPVGAVVVSPHDLVIPGAIGTDINCGMRLHHLGIDIGTFMSKKKEFLHLLKGDLLEGTRDLPTTAKAMQALFQDGLAGFWSEMQKTPKGIFEKMDWRQVTGELNGLHESAFLSGNHKYAPENLMNREWMRDPSFGTLGGSNHFKELQVVKEIVDRKKAYELGIKVGDVVSMIHTGSRDVGFYVGNRWMAKARDLFPKNMKYPENKVFGIEGEMAQEYLSAMTSAAHYATANRAVISECIRQRANEIFGVRNNRLITDVPHNIVLKEKIGNVHRKGATPAYEGQLLLIPGSMGHDSYLLSGLGNEKWLQSASHGAGRSVSRNEMSYKAKKGKNNLGLDGVECITLKEERKIEEAPSAYKEIGPVIQSQVEEKTVEVVAIFSPLVTFKA